MAHKHALNTQKHTQEQALHPGSAGTSKPCRACYSLLPSCLYFSILQVSHQGAGEVARNPSFLWPFPGRTVLSDSLGPELRV